MTVLGWFSSIRKSIALHGISSVLGATRNPQSFSQVMHASDRRTQALSDLTRLVLRDRFLRNIARDYQVDDSELRRLYRDLGANGADKWVMGHWVAASALGYPDTLEFVLKQYRSSRDDCWPDVVSALIDYFQNGGRGRLEP